jgi:glucan 1,3-beta-glucosidase
VTDDTAAIQRAVSSGNRCAPATCKSSSVTPAVVYFPAGTYNISSSIIFYYNTQIIGNPNNLPVLRAAASFTGFGVIDGNQYQPGGVLGFVPQNHFFSQIKNLIIDLTHVPSTLSATGIHWPTSQTTTLQNIIFKLSDAPDTKHWGLFVESGTFGNPFPLLTCSLIVLTDSIILGSALFLSDLVFYGGLVGATLGNQQYTMRNVTFYNAVTAINQLWDWGWLYKSLTVVNCSIGLDMSNGGPTAQAVGSVILIDSYFQDTPVAVSTSHTKSSLPPTAGSLMIENVQFQNVSIIVRGPDKTTVLEGSKAGLHVDAWGQGHSYAPTGPAEFQGPLASPFARPASLVVDGKYYEKSKPSYADLSASELISTRSAGARGDGIADDTKVLQELLTRAAKRGSVVFFDAGTYKVTRTLFIPPGSRIVGEFLPVILSSGLYFADIKRPRPVVQVGHAGQTGTVQWSDMIVSTQGPQAGAILIEWNLASKGEPSGMWDVHVRVGGFAGSELQVAECPTTPHIPTPPAAIDDRCIASYMSMHITKTAANLYLESVWLWVADHDIDNSDNTQITIYAGRGLLIDQSAGPIWL